MAAANYQLTSVPRADNQTRELLVKATEIGIKNELIRALRLVYDQLPSAPEKLGDPLHHTRKPGGMVYNVVVEPISVRYVVYEIDKVVCLLDVKPLSRYFPE